MSARFNYTSENIVLRFDYADAPIEAIDLSFSFQRDTLQGHDPSTAMRIN